MFIWTFGDILDLVFGGIALIIMAICFIILAIDKRKGKKSNGKRFSK